MNDVLKEMERLGNPILHISLRDLKELVKSLNEGKCNSTEKALDHLKNFMLSRKEVADIFGFSQVGLYQWEKRGYLDSVNCNGMAMYQLSVINELMSNPDFPNPQAHKRIKRKKKRKEIWEERETRRSGEVCNPMRNPKFSALSELNDSSTPIEDFEADYLPF